MLLGKAVGDRIRRAIDDTLHLLVTTLLANTEDGQAFWKFRVNIDSRRHVVSQRLGTGTNVTKQRWQLIFVCARNRLHGIKEIGNLLQHGIGRINATDQHPLARRQRTPIMKILRVDIGEIQVRATVIDADICR